MTELDIVEMVDRDRAQFDRDRAELERLQRDLEEVIAAREQTAAIRVTQRELTLIRVSMIQRLGRLKDHCPDCAARYAESRELLNGKLWAAVKGLKSESGEG